MAEAPLAVFNIEGILCTIAVMNFKNDKVIGLNIHTKREVSVPMVQMVMPLKRAVPKLATSKTVSLPKNKRT